MRSRFAVGLSLVVACASFSDAEPRDADGGAASSDGGVPPTDAPAAADVDGDAGDAGLSAVDCTKFQFCDDFERPTPWDVRWSDSGTDPPATMAISDVTSVSPTRSLFIQLPASGTSGRRAFLRRDLDSDAVSATLTFALRMDVRPGDADVMIAEMLTTNGHVFLLIRGSDLVVVDQEMPSNITGTQAVVSAPSTGWQEVVFEYRSTPSPLMSLKVGTQSGAKAVTKGGGIVRAVEIGSAYTTGGGEARYFIDDVRIENVQ